MVIASKIITEIRMVIPAVEVMGYFVYRFKFSKAQRAFYHVFILY